eukprot:343179_1
MTLAKACLQTSAREKKFWVGCKDRANQKTLQIEDIGHEELPLPDETKCIASLLQNIKINKTKAVKKAVKKYSQRHTKSSFATKNRKPKPKPFKESRVDDNKIHKNIKINKNNKLNKNTLKKKRKYSRLKLYNFNMSEMIQKLNKLSTGKIQCPFCTYKNMKWYVIEHMRGHHKNRPYKCLVCSKTFKRPRILKSHMK